MSKSKLPSRYEGPSDEDITHVILWDGCDEACIGKARRCGMSEEVAVYDYYKLLAVFEEQGMTFEDAVEWIEFNLLGAWIGEQTPIIFYPGELVSRDQGDSE